jgi:hypothetical protein
MLPPPPIPPFTPKLSGARPGPAKATSRPGASRNQSDNGDPDRGRDRGRDGDYDDRPVPKMKEEKLSPPTPIPPADRKTDGRQPVRLIR